MNLSNIYRDGVERRNRRKAILQPSSSSAAETFIDSISVQKPLSRLSVNEVQQLCDARISSHFEYCDWQFTKSTLKYLIDLLHEGNPQQDHILDFGCGNGIILDVLSDLTACAPNLRITGVDISELALEQANAKLDGQRESGAKFTLFDPKSLDCQAPIFSGGVANFVMHFNIEDVYINWLAQSIRLGGYFVYNDYRFEKDRTHYENTRSRFAKHGFHECRNIRILQQRRNNHRLEQSVIVLRRQ